MLTEIKKAAEAGARGLAEAGIRDIRLHHASSSPLSYILTDAWRFKGLILGSCTYETRLFPPMRQVVDFFSEKGLSENRRLGLFGSFGWSGGAVKELRNFATRDNWTMVDPVVEVKGAPSQDTLNQCALLGKNMAEAVKS